MLPKLLSVVLIALPLLAQDLLHDPDKLTEEVWDHWHNANLTPQIMPWPPPYYCNMTYPNLTIHYGTYVNARQIIPLPSLWYPPTRRHCTIYITGMVWADALRSVPNHHLRPGTYHQLYQYEWPQMIIGNIPSNRIEEGEIVWEYQIPRSPSHPDHQLSYAVMVFFQKSRLKFHKLNPGQKYEKVYKFAAWYDLGWPEYGNFLHVNYTEG